MVVYVGEGPPLGDGFIEPSVPREQVRQDAYLLPKDFEWCIMDLNDSKQVQILSIFLDFKWHLIYGTQGQRGL